VDIAKLGQNTAFKKQWIGLENGRLVKRVPSVLDEVRQDLMIISKSRHHPSVEVLRDLKRRRLIETT
jgi:hypothetical protein